MSANNRLRKETHPAAEERPRGEDTSAIVVVEKYT